MKTRIGVRLSRKEVVVGIIVVVLQVALLTAVYGKSQIPKHVANCRQIVLSIRLYAADEGGRYPDSAVPGATDSNTVFRQLIITGVLEDEKVFGCAASPFIPDGDIGEKPDYGRAIEPNENHWAMTKGLDDNSPRGIPLVYENPVDATWPPTWNADAAGQWAKGRSWPGGKIIIGTNDTSVEYMKLQSVKGAKVPLKKLNGLNLFEVWAQGDDAPGYEVLDIAWDQDARLLRHRAPTMWPQYWPWVVILVALVLLRKQLRRFGNSVLRYLENSMRPPTRP